MSVPLELPSEDRGAASEGAARLPGGEVPLAPGPRPESRAEPASAEPECARFHDFAGEQIYTVTHAAAGRRRGVVLLCGPFGVERERAYLTLVKWARTLAARGYQVLRFDYRGNGESTGAFEDMTLARWCEDAASCAGRLSAASPGVPLVLQGVRFGALVAAGLFAAGVGDGLLLWAPPASAEALLRETLRHNLIAHRMADPAAAPRTREQLIAALGAGERIEVDGYTWTRDLWQDALRHPLLLPPADEERPWHTLDVRSVVEADRARNPRVRSEAVEADSFWSSSSSLLVPHSEGFFQASLRWLDEHESLRGTTARRRREPLPERES